MGPISTIKKVFINFQFSKAQKCIAKGSKEQAILILNKIINTHSEALTELTQLDFEYAKKYNDADLFRVAIDNRYNYTDEITNRDSFWSVLFNIEKEINQRITLYSKRGDIANAYEYAKLLVHLNGSKPFNVNKLGEMKLAYAVSLKTSNFYKAKELLTELLASTARYPDSINHKVVSEIYRLAETLKNNLSDYSHCNDLCKLLFDKDKRSLPLYLDNCAQNIKQLELNKEELNLFYKLLNQLPVANTIKKYYAQIVTKSESAKREYVNYIIQLSGPYADRKELDQSIAILNEGIATVNDQRLFDRKIEIIKKYPNVKFYDRITLLMSLVGKQEDAEPLLAQLYVELARREKPLDKKRKWIEKALAFKTKNSHVFNEKLYSGIFQNTLSEMLALAQGYSEIGYFEDAYKVLSMLYSYYSSPEALKVFWKIKIIESRNCSLYKKKVSVLESAVEYSNKLSKEYLHINYPQEDILIEILSIAKNQVKVIKSTVEKNSVLKKACLFVEKYKHNSANLLTQLNEIKDLIAHSIFEEGTGLEKEDRIEEALLIYRSVKKQYGFYPEIEARIFICRLKTGEEISKNDCSQIESLLKEKPDAYTQDLAYRYALYLLKKGNRYREVNDIIEHYLPQTQASAPIRKYCKNELIKQALSELDQFNQRLALMNEGNLSIADTQTLLNSLSNLEKTVAAELPDLKGKFLALKDILNNYILKKLFETDKYIRILDFITETDIEFYKNNTSLHNAAAAAYGTAQTGKLNASNYKRIISIWITAVFQDVLFVDSIRYTSWTDQSVFSLYESLGGTGKRDNLPANVDYSDPNDGAVSIGEVQKNRVEDFKKFLTDTSFYSDSQIIEFERFYEQEIKAITDLFALQLKTPCFHATPCFCESNKPLFSAIEKSLENEFGRSGVDSEAVLEIGLTYGLEAKRYKDFQSAKSICNRLTSLTENLNYQEMENQYTSNTMALLKKYPVLYNRFIAKIRSEFEKQIKSEIGFERIHKSYSLICKVTGDTTLNFMLSNYSNKYVDNELSRIIDKVNNKALNHINAMSQLYGLYQKYPNHSKLCDNIIILCDLLIEEEIVGRSTHSRQAKNMLDQLIINRSATLKISANKMATKYNETINQLDPTNRILMTGMSDSYNGMSLNEAGLAIKEGLNYYRKMAQ